jgi:hypothetical protein
MKKSLSAAVMIAVLCCGPAVAENDEAARIAALEQENAQMRKELDELRQSQKRLGQQITRPTFSQTRGEAKLAPGATPIRSSNLRRDPFEAQAAYTAMPVKAGPAIETRGRWRVWGEGGATWTAGDPSLLFYTPIQLNGPLPDQSFNLKPGLGWEGAVGFDYRFANSLWHIGGQFRYGEGRATGSFASNQSSTQTNLINVTSAFDNQTINAVGKERHWLADVTVGRDVLGSGPDALQVKGGVRISEFRAATSSLETGAGGLVFSPAQTVGGVTFTTLNIFSTINTMQEAKFLGAGPVIGFEGSVPFAGHWAFEYAGDAAVLFGSQRYTQSISNTGFSTPVNVFTDNTQTSSFSQKNATVFNPDVQIGVSYWVTPQVKVTGSYRLDAYLNVLTSLSPVNDVTKLQTIDRLIHGPRVAVSAQF